MGLGDRGLELAEFEGTGRGVRTTRNIQKNDLLLEVPCEQVLSGLTIRHSSLFARVSEVYLPPWAFTGCVPCTPTERENGSAYRSTLLYQVLHHPTLSTLLLLLYEKENISQSPWVDLITQMPPLHDHPLFWEEERVHSLPGPTAFPHKLRTTRRKQDSLYERCFRPLFSQYPHIFPPELYTREKFTWAVASMWSRGYWMDDEDTFPAFIPGADMFNHWPGSGNNPVTRYSFEGPEQTFRMYALQSYDVGQQVFSTYGEKNNGEWLLNYGFLFRDNPVRSIGVPLPSPIDLPLVYHHAKQRYIDSNYGYATVDIDDQPQQASWRILRILLCEDEALLDEDDESLFDQPGNKKLEEAVCDYVIPLLAEWVEYPVMSNEQKDPISDLLALYVRENQKIARQLLTVYVEYRNRLEE